MGEKMDLRFNPSHSSWWFLVRAVAKDNGSEPGVVSSKVSWWVTGGRGGGGGGGGTLSPEYTALLSMLCHALSHVLLSMALSAALNKCNIYQQLHPLQLLLSDCARMFSSQCMCLTSSHHLH